MSGLNCDSMLKGICLDKIEEWINTHLFFRTFSQNEYYSCLMKGLSIINEEQLRVWMHENQITNIQVTSNILNSFCDCLNLSDRSCTWYFKCHLIPIKGIYKKASVYFKQSLFRSLTNTVLARSRHQW
jgi:hypothetical protein